MFLLSVFILFFLFNFLFLDYQVRQLQDHDLPIWLGRLAPLMLHAIVRKDYELKLCRQQYFLSKLTLARELLQRQRARLMLVLLHLQSEVAYSRRGRDLLTALHAHWHHQVTVSTGHQYHLQAWLHQTTPMFGAPTATEPPRTDTDGRRGLHHPGAQRLHAALTQAVRATHTAAGLETTVGAPASVGGIKQLAAAVARAAALVPATREQVHFDFNHQLANFYS